MNPFDVSIRVQDVPLRGRGHHLACTCTLAGLLFASSGGWALEVCELDQQCGLGPCIAQQCVACLAGPDCDGDTLPDRCAIARGLVPDCDANGRPDPCDLQGGRLDCDQNGVLDVCEAQPGRCLSQGRRGFVEYGSGTLPFILSVPHGGQLMPADIPDRSESGPHDFYTRELSEDIEKALLRRTGELPHRVTLQLHRIKLDANRDVWDGAQGNPQAIRAWRDYHQFIEEAKSWILRKHGAGLLLDIHGLSSSRKFNELGVLVSHRQLELPDHQLEHESIVAESSVSNLLQDWPGSLGDFLRGPNSLGEFLSQGGFPTVPSFTFPTAEPLLSKGSPYFSGGYITRRHGRGFGRMIDAIQIETRADIRFDPVRRAAFADRLAQGLLAVWEARRGPKEVQEKAIEESPPIWPARVYSGDEIFVNTASPLDIEVDKPARLGPPRRTGDRWALRLELQRPGGRTLFLHTDGRAYPVRIEDPHLHPTLGLWLDGALDLENRAFSSWQASSLGTLSSTLSSHGTGLLFEDEFSQVLVTHGRYPQSQGYTISFVFKPHEGPTGPPHYLYSHGRMRRRSSLNIYLTKSGVLRTAIRGVHDNYGPKALDVLVQEPGFHHYALVVNASEAVVYLDGTARARSKRGFPLGEPSTTLHLGGRHDYARSRGWRGVLDDVKIWSSALSPRQVFKEARQ